MEQGQEKSPEQIKQEREKLLIKAKKIKAVCERGTPQEKASSLNAYHEFLKKNGLTDDEVTGIKDQRVFTIQFEDDAMILTNVISSLCPFTQIECTELYVKCVLDDEDFKETVAKYRVFIKEWRRHKELFIMCFFTKYDKHFKMDEYAYEKFMSSNKPKNEDIAKAEEEDEKMKEVMETETTKGGSFIESKITPEFIEKQRQIKIMERIIPLMPNVFYERKHGKEQERKKAELKA